MAYSRCLLSTIVYPHFVALLLTYLHTGQPLVLVRQHFLPFITRAILRSSTPNRRDWHYSYCTFHLGLGSSMVLTVERSSSMKGFLMVECMSITASSISWTPPNLYLLNLHAYLLTCSPAGLGPPSCDALVLSFTLSEAGSCCGQFPLFSSFELIL